MPSFLAKRMELSWPTLIAYGVSVLGIVCGATGLRMDIKLATISRVRVADYSFDIMCMIWGVLVFIATKLRYQGGIWFVIGTFLIGGAVVGAISLVEMCLQNWHPTVPFYARMVSCWMIGFVLVIIGHLRHCRKSELGS